jgi:hypothetical protein
MSINNIELPVQTLAALYPFSLTGNTEETITNENKKTAPETTKKQAGIIQETEKTREWKWLGNNQQQILVMVNNQDAVHLPDKELSFLTGILTACRLSLADVAIVNINNQPDASYKELTDNFKSKKVFLFGIEPSTFGLPMQFPHYQVQAFTGISFLYAPELKELENDKVEKTKLWMVLKKMFNI